MHKAYDFTFAGVSATMFGVFCCDIGSARHTDNRFGNTAEIIEERVTQRIKPLHFGVNYHNSPLEFTMIFGAEEVLDRYQLQEIANWLTGHQQYQWLSIDQPDMEHIQYRCLIRNLTPVSVGWLPVAFQAEVICDCPYGYSYPFKEVIEVDGFTSVTIYNDSNTREYLRPYVEIEIGAGSEEFTIINKSHGNRETSFTGLPGGAMKLEMDNESCVIEETIQGVDPYQFFNFKFFELVDGDNELEITGNGTLTISGRYLYNVGA